MADGLTKLLRGVLAPPRGSVGPVPLFGFRFVHIHTYLTSLFFDNSPVFSGLPYGALPSVVANHGGL
jgi:hypothetical protein